MNQAFTMAYMTSKLSKMMKAEPRALGSKPRMNPNRILREMVEILRKENIELETKVRAMEKHHLLHGIRSEAAEARMLVMSEAVRVLARAVSADTAIGKKVRAEARAILEQAGLKPPGTLGSSRERKRRRRTKKPGRSPHSFDYMKPP